MIFLAIDSYLIQTIIVAIIVAGALGAILYKLLKPRRKDGDCGCCALASRCNSPKNKKQKDTGKSGSPGAHKRQNV